RDTSTGRASSRRIDRLHSTPPIVTAAPGRRVHSPLGVVADRGRPRLRETPGSFREAPTRRWGTLPPRRRRRWRARSATLDASWIGREDPRGFPAGDRRPARAESPAESGRETVSRIRAERRGGC